MPERRESWSPTTRHTALVNGRVVVARAAAALLGLIGLSSGVSHAAMHGYAARTIRLQPGVSATAFDARTNRLFMATMTSIEVLDGATGGRLQIIRLPLPARNGETTLLLDAPDGRLLVGTTRDFHNTASSGTIITVDTHTGRVLRSVQAGSDATPLVVDQRSKLALVGSSVAAHGGPPGSTIGRLAFIDVRDGQQAAQATLPGSVQDWVFDPGRERAFVLYPLVLQDGWESRHAVVDTRQGRILPGHDREVTGSLPLLDVQRGWAMAVDRAAGLVRVVATATGRVLRTIRVGALPQAAALDPHTGTGYVVSLGEKEAGSLPRPEHAQHPRPGARPRASPGEHWPWRRGLEPEYRRRSCLHLLPVRAVADYRYDDREGAGCSRRGLRVAGGPGSDRTRLCVQPPGWHRGCRRDNAPKLPRHPLCA